MIRQEDSRRGIDYIGVTGVFYCHDGNGHVLLHKRSQNCRDEQGRWDCGGGSMEFGETFEETVRREVMEEYGVEPIKIEYVGTKNVLREHDGRKTHWVKNIHWVLVDPAQVRNNDPEKIDEIGWFTLSTVEGFTLDNPPQPLHSQFEDGVRLLKEYFQKSV
ncbi:NUDIX domain-containing protein [Candidatus Wolfebacteria bacterium]|nr:NUDIX domain-containing protein [Candidatus Wolfebacteria bacterium]